MFQFPRRKTRNETDPSELTPPRGLAWRLGLARGVLAWERLWPRIWPAVAVLTVFIGLALLGVFEALPGWLHLSALVAFAVLFAGNLVRALKRMPWPGPADAQRRLERDSGLQHRPLSALSDALATGTRDAAAAALWQAHRRRLHALLGRLRVAPPRGSLAAADPKALRVVPILILAAGVIAAGSQAPQRLMLAFTPQLASAAAEPARLDVWIDPPGYTGEAPIFLEVDADPAEIVRAPEGSRLIAQLQGGRGDPELRTGQSSEAFERVAEAAWRVEVELNVGQDGEVAIAQDGGTLGRWDMHVVPDHPPEVSFTEAPQRTRRSGLRVVYQAMDDYGLESVRLRIERPEDERIEPIVSDLPPPGGGESADEGASFHDFTDHVWAGLEVEMTLVAEDAVGQSGRSETITGVLPERIFQHPVARALVDLRRELTLEPENRLPVAHALSELGSKPEHYHYDTVVTLALGSAERRLMYDRSERGLSQVQELMWETALRIEDGEMAIAERDLREAEQALMDALSREDVSAEDLQRLMDELEAAMDRFLEAMAEEMRERMAEGEEFQTPPETEFMESHELRDMLDQMRDMAEMGQLDSARDMLSQLQEMLQNLHMEPMSAEMMEQMQQAMDMMRSLDTLTDQQQELLDRSFEQSQQGRNMDSGQLQGGQPGQQRNAQPQQGQQGQQGEGGSSAQGDAERQEALRRQLGKLMRELGNALGDIPRPLGQAEQDMRGASEALRQGDSESAIQPQSDALDNLRQGMESMQQAFQEQMMGEGGEGQGTMGMRPGGGDRDPLGRSRDRQGRGHIDSGDVEVPDGMELQRAREILNELRRRAGDRDRPEIELDYIERLLRQF